jgi:uncharacterized membrane protein YfcA
VIVRLFSELNGSDENEFAEEASRLIDNNNPLILLIINFVIGLLIGTVGIGGILMAPMLVYLAGIDLHLAMATSSLSFLFAGIAGTIAYASKGSISWNMVGWLSVGVIPAALFGAKTNVELQAGALTVILAALIVASGLNALLRKPLTVKGRFRANRFVFVSIGLAVGFGSALTGTGGPVLVLPILIFINLPALAAIGVSQAIQLPIAIFASAGFLLFGRIDIELGVQLGLIMAIGVVAGAQIAHRVTAKQLKRVVAIVLIAVGLFMMVRS